MTSGVGRRPGLTSKTLAPAHVHSGSDITSGTVATARLGAGGDGSGNHILFDDGTWGDPVGAVIAETILSSPSGSITFSSVPSTFTSLVLVYQCRGSDVVQQSELRVRLNGDSGSNYNSQLVAGNNTTAFAAVQSSGTYGHAGYITASLATAGYSSSGSVEIPNYTGTTFFKNAIYQTTRDVNGAGVNMVHYRGHIVWKSTTAVSSITLTLNGGQFVTGSFFKLYGIR